MVSRTGVVATRGPRATSSGRFSSSLVRAAINLLVSAYKRRCFSIAANTGSIIVGDRPTAADAAIVASGAVAAPKITERRVVFRVVIAQVLLTL